MRRTLETLILVAILWTTPIAVQARVVRVDVDRSEPVLAGKTFGLAGPYEKVVGTIHFAVDPRNPANREVVDLELAEKNEGGEVTFSADLYVLRPLDPRRGNGTLLIEVPNRGGKAMLGLLNGASGSLDPGSPEEYGDGFLLRQGFTLAWIGWQFDVPEAPGRMRLSAPVAEGVEGLVRSDFTLAEPATFVPLGHLIAGRIGGTEYPVADPRSEHDSLSVRDRPEDERLEIPRRRWSFVREDGTITGVEYPQGFEPGRIYELIYAAADPAVVGLGLVAIRDYASWAKYEQHGTTPVDFTIAFGISQSGRFLRHYLYQGFNADEQGRRALDGIMSHVAGAGRGSFNHRFAQPSRDGQPMDAIFYPTDLYPFADLPLEDPVTGRREGLLDRLSATDDVTPKIFYTNTAYEYWGRAASLIHTTPDGRADAQIPDSVRIYFLAGLQHFPRPLPPRRMEIPQIRGRYVMNPNPSAWTMRALVDAMQAWVASGEEPPPSRYPRIDEGTLVPFETVVEKFPAIPGVDLPRDVHHAYRIDYGPQWEERGIITRHPPRVGEAFPVLVPDVDADGNDRGGIRIPQLETPIATYTPWNLRDPSIGAPSERVSFLGSYFPFPADEQERESVGDPRRSIGERYPTFDGYLARYAKAAMELVDRGFLRAEDLDDVIERGGREWHYANEGIESPLVMQSDELSRLEQIRPDLRVAYGEPPFRFGELRSPEGEGPFPVAVMIHGGCWLAKYDLSYFGSLARALTDAGIATWTIEYNRVGDPHGGWPGTFLDVAAATDHLRVLAREHALDLDRVIAVGHSAGGQLALWLAARGRIPRSSPLYAPDPLPISGVLGLAAAVDLDYLHEIEVCGHVIDRLMGGGPKTVADRYDAASPSRLVPLDVPQILINGTLDPFWSTAALKYLDAAREAGAPVKLIEAGDSGHFEMVDPASSTWPTVRDAVLDLLASRD